MLKIQKVISFISPLRIKQKNNTYIYISNANKSYIRIFEFLTLISKFNIFLTVNIFFTQKLFENRISCMLYNKLVFQTREQTAFQPIPINTLITLSLKL